MEQKKDPRLAAFERARDTRTLIGVGILLGTTSGLVAAIVMKNSDGGNYNGLAGLFGFAVALAYGSIIAFLRRD